MTRPAWHKPGRGNRHAQGYGSAWDKLRKTILERDKHLCQACLANGRVRVGNQCDHIIPKAKGGTDDPGNLRILCRDCHNEKTIRDSGRRVRPTFAADGWPIGD